MTRDSSSLSVQSAWNVRRHIALPLTVDIPSAIEAEKCFAPRNPLHSSLCAGFRALKASKKSAPSDILFSGNRLTVAHDVKNLGHGQLLDMLAQMGVSTPHTWWWRLKRRWLEYLDNSSRENAQRPPPVCCSHPQGFEQPRPPSGKCRTSRWSRTRLEKVAVILAIFAFTPTATTAQPIETPAATVTDAAQPVDATGVCVWGYCASHDQLKMAGVVVGATAIGTTAVAYAVGPEAAMATAGGFLLYGHFLFDAVPLAIGGVAAWIYGPKAWEWLGLGGTDEAAPTNT